MTQPSNEAKQSSSGTAAGAAVTLDAVMQPLTVGQDGHSAFPGMNVSPDGVMHLVWRYGSAHISPDGKLMTASSLDGGATWVNPQVMRANPDYRDPSISTIDGVEYLTWFGANATNPAMGAGVMRAWNTSRRIDLLPYGAISAPLVKLPDGRIGAAFYGRQAGEALDTAFMGWSSDSGWTWTTNRIVNMIGSGVATAEPYLVVNGSTTHMLYRWGANDGIGIRSSPDSGATWGPVRKVIDNATGRPTVIATASGTLVVVYRERPSKNAVMAYSVDNGATWLPGGTVLAAPAGSPIGMTYAAMVETSPGTVRIVVGMEQPDGSSDLWGGTVTVP